MNAQVCIIHNKLATLILYDKTLVQCSKIAGKLLYKSGFLQNRVGTVIGIFFISTENHRMWL